MPLCDSFGRIEVGKSYKDIEGVKYKVQKLRLLVAHVGLQQLNIFKEQCITLFTGIWHLNIYRTYECNCTLPPLQSAEVLCGCYIPVHTNTHHTTWSGHTGTNGICMLPPPPTKIEREFGDRVLKGGGGGGKTAALEDLSAGPLLNKKGLSVPTPALSFFCERTYDMTIFPRNLSS